MESISKYTSQKLFLWVISVFILTLYNLTPSIDGFDTPYYFLAGENVWNGTIDCLRTPVYPFLLKLFNVCFGDKGGVIGIIILQSIVYLVSVASLQNISRHIINNPLIRNTVCLLYVVCVAPGWCNELLTESLSISGCIIITDLICRYIRKPSWQFSIVIFFLTILLVFMRPSFIFIFAILSIVWTVLWIRKNNRTIQVISLSLTILCATMYLGYCKAYEKEYGVFTSSLSIICDLYNLKQSDTWDLEKVNNPQVREVLYKIDKKWCGNYCPIYDEVNSNHKNLQYIVLGCNEMKKGAEKNMLMLQLKIITESFNKRFNASVNTHTLLSAILFISSLFLALPLSLFYSIVVISCVALTIFILKKREIPLMATVLVLFTSAQCAGILLYASEAHERLLLPVYPIFLILLGIMVEKCLILCKYHQ